MYSYLKGLIVSCDIDELVLDVNDIGYRLSITSKDSGIFQNYSKDEKITVYTFLHIKEDAHTLYGFSSRETKELFVILKNVNGIGPKTALSVLSDLSSGELIQAVMAGDIVRITAIPGIGKKTAERMVLELKDKFKKLSFSGEVMTVDQKTAKLSAELEAESLTAFKSLGYSYQESKKMLRDISKNIDESTTLEQVITLALKQHSPF